MYHSCRTFLTVTEFLPNSPTPEFQCDDGRDQSNRVPVSQLDKEQIEALGHFDSIGLIN
jgi:hypothetical protein